MSPLYLRVPSKRVAMVSRKVFCGARRPFITGILTQMWDGQQLPGGHTIPEARPVASRGSQQAWGETSTVTVQCRPLGHTFTATLSPSAASPKDNGAAWQNENNPLHQMQRFRCGSLR